MTRSSGKRWLRTLALFLLLLAAARFTDCSPTLFWARRSHLTNLISAMLPYGADVRHRHGAGIVSGAAAGPPVRGKSPCPQAAPVDAAAAGAGAPLLPYADFSAAGYVLVWLGHLLRYRGHYGLHLCHFDPADL